MVSKASVSALETLALTRHGNSMVYMHCRVDTIVVMEHSSMDRVSCFAQLAEVSENVFWWLLSN